MFASSAWHQGLRSQGISLVRFMWLRLHIHKLNDAYLFTLFKCNLFITNAFIQKLWFDGVLTVTCAHVIIVTIQWRTVSSFFIKLFCVLYHSVSTPKQSQTGFCQYRYVDKVIWLTKFHIQLLIMCNKNTDGMPMTKEVFRNMWMSTWNGKWGVANSNDLISQAGNWNVW